MSHLGAGHFIRRPTTGRLDAILRQVEWKSGIAMSLWFFLVPLKKCHVLNLDSWTQHYFTKTQSGPHMFVELQTSKKSSNRFGFQFHLKGRIGKHPDDYLTRQIAFDKAYDYILNQCWKTSPDMDLGKKTHPKK